MAWRDAIVAGMLLCCVGMAAAQQEESFEAEPAQVVEISGQASTVLLRYKQALAAMDVYQQHLALAPEASLTFRLVRQLPGVKTRGVQVLLQGEHSRQLLEISGNGLVSMPRSAAALEDDANLLINRRQGAISVEPNVKSRGLPEGARRLGDLRLECLVKQAMGRVGMSLLKRAISGTLGRCNAMHFAIVSHSPDRYAGYLLRDGERSSTSGAAQLKDGGRVLVVPLDDASWPDDTLVYVNLAKRD